MRLVRVPKGVKKALIGTLLIAALAPATARRQPVKPERALRQLNPRSPSKARLIG
jgi:hypothetical protein